MLRKYNYESCISKAEENITNDISYNYCVLVPLMFFQAFNFTQLLLNSWSSSEYKLNFFLKTM